MVAVRCGEKDPAQWIRAEHVVAYLDQVAHPKQAVAVHIAVEQDGAVKKQVIVPVIDRYSIAAFHYGVRALFRALRVADRAAHQGRKSKLFEKIRACRSEAETGDMSAVGQNIVSRKVVRDFSVRGENSKEGGLCIADKALQRGVGLRKEKDRCI